MDNDFHEDVLNREASADDLKRAKARFWEKMRRFCSRIPFARQAAALYYLITDKKADLGIKGTAVLALLYFISPVDMVPDMIPLTGMLDDATVIGAAISMIGPALGPYLKLADAWVARGAPLRDEPDEEVILDVDVRET
jgi:uncharacterized membrane protein YkvA (DUF1232 family)